MGSPPEKVTPSVPDPSSSRVSANSRAFSVRLAISFCMLSPSTSRLSAQMEEVFFLFSFRSKYVASSGRTVSLAVIPARRPPVKVWISCKAEWIWRIDR